MHHVPNEELFAWALFRLWPVAGVMVAALAVLIIVGVPPVWWALVLIVPMFGVVIVSSIVDRGRMNVTMDVDFALHERGPPHPATDVVTA